MIGADDFDARLAAALPPARYSRVQPRRFLVSATGADGSTQNWQRQGGASIDHAQEAQEVAGLGGVVRVVPLDV